MKKIVAIICMFGIMIMPAGCISLHMMLPMTSLITGFTAHGGVLETERIYSPESIKEVYKKNSETFDAIAQYMIAWQERSPEEFKNLSGPSEWDEIPEEICEEYMKYRAAVQPAPLMKNWYGMVCFESENITRMTESDFIPSEPILMIKASAYEVWSDMDKEKQTVFQDIVYAPNLNGYEYNGMTGQIQPAVLNEYFFSEQRFFVKIAENWYFYSHLN